jgi:hypothetical protein
MMSRLFSTDIANYYEAYYENKGATFLKGEIAAEFLVRLWPVPL